VRETNRAVNRFQARTSASHYISLDGGVKIFGQTFGAYGTNNTIKLTGFVAFVKISHNPAQPAGMEIENYAH